MLNRLKSCCCLSMACLAITMVSLTSTADASDRLVAAVKTKDIKTVETLVQNGADVNAADKHGTTPLIQAVESGSVEIAALLLSKGADVTLPGKKPKHSILYRPLELAFEKKEKNGCIPLLLKHPVDCTYQGKYTGSYLHMALLKEKRETFDFEKTIDALIKKGCDVNARDKNGQTPVFNATTDRAFELMVKYGADLSVKNNQGQNLFFRINSAGMGRLLLKNARLDINQQDNDGSTPIFFAKDREYIKFLLKNKADPLHVNKKGGAPIFSIFDRNGDYLALVENGVSINHAYGPAQSTFAHHIMKTIDEKMKSYKNASRPVYSTGNKSLDALFLMTNAFMQTMSRIDILKSIVATARLTKLNADFSIQDADQKSALESLVNAAAKKQMEDLISSKPLESAPLDYGVVLTMILTNLVPGQLDLDKMKEKTSDAFLKRKIEACKKLPRGKYTWKDVDKQVSDMLK